VLVCPECNTKHPLTTIGERRAFPCEGCGRQLKVPAAAMAAVPSGVVPAATARPPAPEAAPRRPAPAEPATSVLPVAEPPPPMPRAVEPDAPAKRDPVPPVWIRFLLWIVAIPLAFAVVFGFARAAGMLTTNQISDVALAEGLGRFWPIARLIPFVALAAAGFVQGSVFLIAQLRRRRWTEKAVGPPHTNGAGPRGAPARSRSQSTRTRA
jgi:hypothetical protein